MDQTLDRETSEIELHADAAGRAERRDAAANRLRLLNEARRLFAEEGVANVNMAMVARAAGVGKGTLYRNFAHKGELCLALIDEKMRIFQDEQLAMMRESTARGEKVTERLAKFLEALVAFTRANMPLLCEIQQHGQALDAAEAERPHLWQYSTVRGLLRQAVAAGELPADLDTAFVAESLLAPLGANAFRFERERLGFSEERIAAGLRAIVAGLAALGDNDGDF